LRNSKANRSCWSNSTGGDRSSSADG
jgi:hypothetical protein